MDTNRLTQKALEALQESQRAAMERGNSQIEPLHLLYALLAQQEGQEHEHAAVVDNPPHVDVALQVALVVAGVEGDVLGHKQGQMGSRGAAHSVWGEGALSIVSPLRLVQTLNH